MWLKSLGGLDLTGRIKLILKQKLDLIEMTDMEAAKVNMLYFDDFGEKSNIGKRLRKQLL
jgi:hypothetical protein